MHEYTMETAPARLVRYLFALNSREIGDLSHTIDGFLRESKGHQNGEKRVNRAWISQNENAGFVLISLV